MPRVADQYAVPVGTDGVTDTTIESTKYNSFVHDVELDLNTARPIVAGGTGATDATGARTNLKAEVAMQKVTNYNTHIFENGSFYSSQAVGIASGAPVDSDAFVGTAYLFGDDPLGYQVLVATNITDHISPGRTFVREKDAGVWGPWINKTSSGEDIAIDYTNNSTVIGTKQRLLMINPTTVFNAGSEVVFAGGGAAQQRYAAISTGIVDTGGGGAAGDIAFATKATPAATALTTRLAITAAGIVAISNAAIINGSLAVGSTVGALFGSVATFASAADENLLVRRGSSIGGPAIASALHSINNAGASIPMEIQASSLVLNRNAQPVNIMGITTTLQGLHITTNSGAVAFGPWIMEAVNGRGRAIYVFGTTEDGIGFYGLGGSHNIASLDGNGFWVNASDERSKKNIRSLNKYGIETLMALKPREYDSVDTGDHLLGFIAQEVRPVMPEIVGEVPVKDDNAKDLPATSLTLNYSGITPLLVAVIQEQEMRLRVLEGVKPT